MAAPSGTKWGSIVGGYGRIGIYVSVSNVSSTQSKRHTEIWFWSKYSVHDSSNTFYYNDQSTSATTSKGSVNISTSVDSGGGWSTSNQQKIASYDADCTRFTSPNVRNVAVKLTGIERVGGTMTCTTSYTIPAKPSYTVTFVNGYGGTIKTQTVYHGGNASAPANPTRTGYTFAGWSGTYTNVTSSRTITATWSIWKYTISYNANGGSGAPGSQTKNYGSNITLSTTRPTRANYNFLGWATSASGGVAYNPGSTYSANANVTLYAVWRLAYQKPRISGFTVQRCNSAGTASESGTYAKVSFSWSTDRTVKAVYVQWRAQSSSSWSGLSIDGSGTSGSVSGKIFGSNALSTDVTYIVRIYVSDDGGTTYSSELSIGTIKYPIDVKAKGLGVAIGKVAETDDLFDVGWNMQFRGYLQGQILRSNSGGTWISGRNNAAIKNVANPSSSYAALTSSKTVNGSFETGTINNQYVISYCSDSNYNSGNNETTKLTFYSDGGLSVPLKVMAPKFEGRATSADYATNAGSASNLSNTYIRTSGGEWIGLYDSSGRKAWFGHDGSPDITFHNESGSLFSFSTAKGGYRAQYLYETSGSYRTIWRPSSGGAGYLGTDSFRWNTLFTQNSVNVKSDLKDKAVIGYIDKSKEFIMGLKPILFNLKTPHSNGKRIHMGFGAQHVSKLIKDINMGDMSIVSATIIKDGEYERPYYGEDIDDEYLSWGINYTEFIAPLVALVQEQQKEIEIIKNILKGVH